MSNEIDLSTVKWMEWSLFFSSIKPHFHPAMLCALSLSWSDWTGEFNGKHKKWFDCHWQRVRRKNQQTEGRTAAFSFHPTIFFVCFVWCTQTRITTPSQNLFSGLISLMETGPLYDFTQAHRAFWCRAENESTVFLVNQHSNICCH